MSLLLFIAYSRHDIEIKNALKNHLHFLVRTKKVKIWDDSEIDPGKEWEQEIFDNLSTADITLLLVSSDSIASDFFYNKEVEYCMKRHYDGDGKVIPLIIRACHWKTLPFARLQIPLHGVAIKSHNNIDEAFFEVALKIESVVKKLRIEKFRQLLDNAKELYSKNEFDKAIALLEQSGEYLEEGSSLNQDELDLLLKQYLEDNRITVNKNNSTDVNPKISISQLIKNGSTTVVGENEKLNEVRVIFLGSGSVGKTSLIKRIFEEKFEETQSATQGIQIRQKTITDHKSPVNCYFWDFGGQEIMHSTHRFFLSKRCIYVVVLNQTREDDPNYWFRQIDTFGGLENAEIILVFSKADQKSDISVDHRSLKLKYPFILEIFVVSSKEGGREVNEFRQSLFERIRRHRLVNLSVPTNWLSVKKNIVLAKDNLIERELFSKLCKEYKITKKSDQADLLNLLNDLGLILNVNLSGTNFIVLNSLWLIDSVYNIINSKYIINNKGIFTMQILHELLDMEDEHIAFIVKTMKYFEICFESIRDQEFVLPELLPILDEDLNEFSADKGEKSILLVVKFPEYMPTSIFPQLMVRTKHLNIGKVWRNIIMLEDKEENKSKAFIKLNRQDLSIEIKVKGQDPRYFLYLIRQEIKEICHKYNNINIEEWIPISDNTQVKYSTLTVYENIGRDIYFSPELEQDFEVQQLLEGLETPQMRIAADQMPL